MRLLSALLITTSLAAACTVPARAGTVLDRIRATGTLRCGADARPGLLDQAPNGQLRGMLLEICGAVASVILPDKPNMHVTVYEADNSYDTVRKGEDDLVFLTGGEIREQDLAGVIIPGPTVFALSSNVMVPKASGIAHLSDLNGKSICFSMGSRAEPHLEAWAAAHHYDFRRGPFQEDSELYDAYNSQYCTGLAAEITTLASVRLDKGPKELDSVILPEPLARYPLIAATPTSDGQFASLVAWAVHTLMRAEVKGTDHSPRGLVSMQVPGAPFGLRDNWQQDMVAKSGTYADMFRRNLGEDSPLRLARDANALDEDGGMLLQPYAE